MLTKMKKKNLKIQNLQFWNTNKQTNKYSGDMVGRYLSPKFGVNSLDGFWKKKIFTDYGVAPAWWQLLYSTVAQSWAENGQLCRCAQYAAQEESSRAQKCACQGCKGDVISKGNVRGKRNVDLMITTTGLISLNLRRMCSLSILDRLNNSVTLFVKS